MPERGARDEMSIRGRELPPWACLRLITIGPGESRAYVPADWRGVMVLVEEGELELESLRGRRWRFEEGAILPLCGLPLRAIHNPGREVTVLGALSRRARAPRRSDEEDDDLS